MTASEFYQKERGPYNTSVDSITTIKLMEQYAQHSAQERLDSAIRFIMEKEYEWINLKIESPASILNQALKIASGLKD